MIFVKFILTNGVITVDEQQAKNILNSKDQLIPIKNLDGEWTYETINKAFIIRTQLDFEKIKDWSEKEKKLKLEIEAKAENERLLAMPPEEREKIEKKSEDARARISEMLFGVRKKMTITDESNAQNDLSPTP